MCVCADQTRLVLIRLHEVVQLESRYWFYYLQTVEDSSINVYRSGSVQREIAVIPGGIGRLHVIKAQGKGILFVNEMTGRSFFCYKNKKTALHRPSV